MLLPNRHGNSADYRYGFQGQELDDEIKGEGNSLNYKYRIHDPRVGRFFAVDPLYAQYAYNSPYAFSENKVIAFNELEGREISPTKQERESWSIGRKVGIGVVDGTIIFTKGSWDMIKNPPKTMTESAEFGFNLGDFLFKETFAWVMSPTNEEGRKLIKQNLNTRQRSVFGSSINSENAILPVRNGIILTAERVFNGDSYDRTVIASETLLGILTDRGVGGITKFSRIFTLKGAINSVAKLKLIREQFNISKGKNIAWIEGKVDGNDIDIVAHSGSKSSKPGTSPVPSISRFFETNKINKNSFDSEIKLLEEFARKYENNLNVKGSIEIFSERAFCDSCRDAIFKQFNEIFPNIEIKTGADGIK